MDLKAIAVVPFNISTRGAEKKIVLFLNIMLISKQIPPSTVNKAICGFKQYKLKKKLLIWDSF
jgi:hypothetical protein